VAIREVEREEWQQFFSELSRTHKGWLVIIEVLRDDLGAQTEVRALPFQGITAESAGGAEYRLELLAGFKPADHISQSIERPLRVWMSTLDQPGGEVVEVECAGQQKILIRFLTASRSNLPSGPGNRG
jgi:hypothetical protein